MVSATHYLRFTVELTNPTYDNENGMLLLMKALYISYWYALLAAL